MIPLIEVLKVVVHRNKVQQWKKQGVAIQWV